MDATYKGTPGRRGPLRPVAAFLMALLLAVGFALRIPTLAWADEPKDISGYEVNFASGDYYYNGTEIEPEVFGLGFDENDTYDYIDLSDEDTASHFDITYKDNINVGEATITVAAKEGDGEYAGAATAAFIIEPHDIEQTDITYDPQVLYEGTPVYPRLSIVYEGITLVEGRDYEVEYSANDGESERVSGTITGMGNFTGVYDGLEFAVVKVESIELAGWRLVPGQTKEIYVTVNCTDDGEEYLADYYGHGFTWTSSDTSVVTVDDENRLTGIAPGTATVTATTPGGKTASCTVTVMEATGAQFTQYEYAVMVGDNFQLELDALPGYEDDGFVYEDVTGMATNWTSSDESVATVDEDWRGWVRAIGAGSCTISCEFNGETYSVTVEVFELDGFDEMVADPSSVEVTATREWWPEYDWIFLVDNQGNKVARHSDSLVFESEDESIATVDESGQIFGESEGTTTIHVAHRIWDDESGDWVPSGTLTCDITVTVLGEGLEVESDPLYLYPNSSNRQYVCYRMSYDSPDVTFTIADTSIAELDEYDIDWFVGKKVGTTTATVSDGTYSTTFRIEVRDKPDSISFKSNNSEVLYLGGERLLDVYAQPGGVNLDRSAVTWTSSNPEVATISDYGSVCAKAAGTTTITAEVMGCTESIDIEVAKREPRAFTNPSGDSVMCYPIDIATDDHSWASIVFDTDYDEEHYSRDGYWSLDGSLLRDFSETYWRTGAAATTIQVSTINALWAHDVTFTYADGTTVAAELKRMTEEDECYLYEIPADAPDGAVLVTVTAHTGDDVYSISDNGVITFKDGTTPNASKLSFDVPSDISLDLVYGGSTRNTIRIYTGDPDKGSGYYKNYDWYLWPDSVTHIMILGNARQPIAKPTLDPPNAGTITWTEMSQIAHIKLNAPATLRIGGYDISRATVSAIADKVYNKKAQKPAPTVMIGEKKLVKDTDYTLSYKNNTKVGTASVIITGKGAYTGTKTVAFKIKNKATMTAKATKSLQTVAYSKVKKKAQSVKKAITVKGAKGKVAYELVSSSKTKKFKVSAKGVITVPKGAKKGTYKVKVKVTDAGNTKYMGATKTVTVKIKVK